VREPSFHEALKGFVNDQLVNLWTCIPCVVLTVHQGLKEQKVDVQPIIKKVDYEGKSFDHPPILGVPLIFPSSKSSGFTFPIERGDTVLCLFSQRGLDTFKTSNGTSQAPTDFRKFDKRDAIAIPGLFPFGNAINNPSKRTYPHDTKDAVISHNIGKSTEVEIRLKPDGTLVVNSPIKTEVNAPNVEVNSEDTTVNTTTSTINSTESATINTALATITAATKISLTAPIVSINGS
jgi:hypothetical protein